MSATYIGSFHVNDGVLASAGGRRRSVPRLNIGTISIDLYTEREFVSELVLHALHGSATKQVVTANAQFYVLAGRSRRLRECIRKAEYVCADGMPIAWSCKKIAARKVPRIAGVDLVEAVCREGAADGLRVFLLGGKDGSAAATADVLQRRYPGIQIVGVCCPPYGFQCKQDSVAPLLDAIREAKPQVLFVGLGAPKQELFIEEHIRPLGIPLAMGVGGSFEMISGKVERAPVWMQKSGLEWMFRLSQEPNRLWKRYLLGNVEFLWRMGRWALFQRRAEVSQLFASGSVHLPTEVL